MGVRDLTRLLQRFAPTAIKEHHPHHYRGWSVAIDASLYLHRFVYAGQLQYAYPHVVGFYGLCRHLRAWKMRPVFVFDGEQRAEAKERESERRRRLKDQTERELYASHGRAQRLERLVHLLKRVAYVTGDYVADIKRLLELWGYLHITSNDYEAEAMCVSLTAAGISQATISEDTDAAAFGDYPLLRHFYVRDRPVFEMNFGVARQALGMTRRQFVDMCILCGTDFSSTLEGIGPVRALKLMQKHGSIEEIVR
ncbi:PIN domain-like protein, partial [Syncephalis pseudoplumigaleata]